MKLTIEPLNNAWESLNKAVNRAKQAPDDLEVRDACIQRFEYTFELSIKTIKRFIEFEIPIHGNVDQMNYRDLLRIAFEIGLIHRIDDWFTYREARNQTSHAYDQNKAKAVFEVVLDFVIRAHDLIQQLTKRLK